LRDFDVVVIGAGVIGLSAAAALARAGRSVVVIERNPAHPRIDELRDAYGAVVVTGDITSDAMLSRLRLERARQALLLTGDDFSNLDAAAKMLHMAPGLAGRIVVHVGDLFFHGRYPRIDLEGGGSLAAWIESLDRVLELEFDLVIPGHGPVADRAALVAFQDFLRELWQVASQAAADGRSLEDTVATARLTRDAGFGSMHIPFVVHIDRESVLGEAWREATRGAAAAP